MGSIKWVGDPNAAEKEDTPESMEAFGLVFKDGEVETEDYTKLKKASANPFFEVEGLPDESPRDAAVHVPPSQQSAQYPVPKAGDPVVPEEPPTEPTAEPKAVEDTGAKAPTFRPIPRV